MADGIVHRLVHSQQRVRCPGPISIHSSPSIHIVRYQQVANSEADSMREQAVTIAKSRGTWSARIWSLTSAIWIGYEKVLRVAEAIGNPSRHTREDF